MNAVDNIKAKHYVDAQCVWYEKPLLESGTLGMKANTQMVVPHKTLCYGDSHSHFPEVSMEMVYITDFPNLMEHCIEWGLYHFKRTFTDPVQNALNFTENPTTFLADLRKSWSSFGAMLQLE